MVMGNSRKMRDNHVESDLDATGAVDSDLSVDPVLETLSHPYARYTLAYLSDKPDATLDTLAEVIAGAEAGGTNAVATSEDLRRVRIRLYHVVLPKLDDVGYVDFDPGDRNVVRSGVPPSVYSLLGIDD
jgi:hypothetical protein